MYIKILGDRVEDVTHLVPAHKVSYTKHVIGGKEEFEKIKAVYADYWQPYFVPDDLGDGFGVPMYIIDTWQEDGTYARIILCCGFAYVMNENGKTIDKIA